MGQSGLLQDEEDIHRQNEMKRETEMVQEWCVCVGWVGGCGFDRGKC